MEKIIIIGAGGHAKTVVDTIERGHCFEIAGFLAEGRVGERVYKNYTILGADNIAKTIFSMGISKACMAIGFMGKSSIREKLCCQYKKMGFDFPAIIDPSAIVASDVMIGEGTYIGRCVVVNANSSIGDFCILNTGCIVEHECKAVSYTHLDVYKRQVFLIGIITMELYQCFILGGLLYIYYIKALKREILFM